MNEIEANIGRGGLVMYKQIPILKEMKLDIYHLSSAKLFCSSNTVLTFIHMLLYLYTYIIFVESSNR